MKWITNCRKKAYNPRDFGCPNVAGRPRETEKYSTERLESWGMIGVYRVDDILERAKATQHRTKYEWAVRDVLSVVQRAWQAGLRI